MSGEDGLGDMLNRRGEETGRGAIGPKGKGKIEKKKGNEREREEDR